MEKEPENKEMSDKEINTMLDKMLSILNSFGSKDPQFLKEYNKAEKNINYVKQKGNINFKMLFNFTRNNLKERRGRVQVKIVNE